MVCFGNKGLVGGCGCGLIVLVGGPVAKIRFYSKLGLIRYPDSDARILTIFFQGADRPLNGYQRSCGSWWILAVVVVVLTSSFPQHIIPSPK